MLKVDHVLNSGIARSAVDDYEVFNTKDRIASEAVNTQRDGRAGRIKSGCSTRVVAKNLELAGSALPVSLRALEAVVAVSYVHFRVQPDRLRFCPVPMQSIEMLRQRMGRLQVSAQDGLTAVTKLPFRIRDAAAGDTT
jgi:hypothetical protein